MYKFEGYVKELKVAEQPAAKQSGAKSTVANPTVANPTEANPTEANPTVKFKKTCKFNIRTAVNFDGQEVPLAKHCNKKQFIELKSDEFDIKNNNIFNFISQHSKEKLCVAIEKNKGKKEEYTIKSVTLIYG